MEQVMSNRSQYNMGSDVNFGKFIKAVNDASDKIGGRKGDLGSKVASWIIGDGLIDTGIQGLLQVLGIYDKNKINTLCNDENVNLSEKRLPALSLIQ